MSTRSYIIPAMSAVFGAGVSAATLEALAKDTEDLEVRVEKLEDSTPKGEVIEIKIQGVEKRLDKLEELVAKMLEVQQVQSANQAAICQATQANCSR